MSIARQRGCYLLPSICAWCEWQGFRGISVWDRHAAKGCPKDLRKTRGSFGLFGLGQPWRVLCVFWARGVQTQKHFRAQKKSKEVKGLLTSFGLGYYGRVEWSKDRVQTQKKWSKEGPLARFFRAPLGLLGLLGGVQTGPKLVRWIFHFTHVMSVVDAWNQKSAFWAKKLAQETKFLRTLHFQTEMYSEARSGAVRTARLSATK